MPHGMAVTGIFKPSTYAGYVGEYTSLPNDQTSIKIDKDDDACIAYCDWGNYCLKYLTLPNSTGYATKYIRPSAFLTVTPNPVEVGRVVSINITLTPQPPMATDYYQNITVKLTNPDGTSTTLGPFFSNNGTVFTHVCTDTDRQLLITGKIWWSIIPPNVPSQRRYLLCYPKQRSSPYGSTGTSRNANAIPFPYTNRNTRFQPNRKDNLHSK